VIKYRLERNIDVANTCRNGGYALDCHEDGALELAMQALPGGKKKPMQPA